MIAEPDKRKRFNILSYTAFCWQLITLAFLLIIDNHVIKQYNKKITPHVVKAKYSIEGFKPFILRKWFTFKLLQVLEVNELKNNDTLVMIFNNSPLLNMF